MTGKLIGVLIVITALAAGAAIYYLQVYAYYRELPDAEVGLTSLATGETEVIAADGIRAIDADSSPIRYRACFTLETSLAILTEIYAPYDDPVPLTGPGWFGCYDADSIAAALAADRALAFTGARDITYGIDRVVAVTDAGRGYVWHQINRCGEAVFDGEPPPPGCPPPPERTD